MTVHLDKEIDSLDLVVPPGVSATTFRITFAPASPGTTTATLRIASNDPDESIIDITLTGQGYIPPRLATEVHSGTAFIRMPPLGWGNNELGQTTIPAAAATHHVVHRCE